MKKINIKRVATIISIIIIVAALLLIVLKILGNDSGDSLSKDISIKYESNKKIDISNVTSGEVYKNTVTVTNNTDEDQYYYARWKDVYNGFIDANKIVYKIDSHESGSLFVAESQLPMSDYKFDKKIRIGKNSTHTYYISVTFKGDVTKEKRSVFQGIIDFYK